MSLRKQNNKKQKDKTLSFSNFLKIILESWRLKTSFERVVPLLESKEQKKNLSKIKWYENNLVEVLASCDLKLATFDGEPYSTGIPATPVNIEDFESEDDLYVKHTIEPTIIDESGSIVHSGSIIVEKA